MRPARSAGCNRTNRARTRTFSILSLCSHAIRAIAGGRLRRPLVARVVSVALFLCVNPLTPYAPST